MVLESTIICVDNSEYMRNGDYVPTRLQAQQDAVNTICRFKLRSNPENNVGLLTLANTEVLATLTTDVGKILTSLHKVMPNGFINLLTGIRIAHLALKHRQSKNHKMRIVAFVGSPIEADEKEIIKVAKRLKKEKVNIDIVNFGETVQDINQSLLEAMVSTINGREGGGSHLVTVPPSPHLADALLSSPIVQGEDGGSAASFATGGGFEFGVDPNEDPELALALRVSMEEQRQRQQEEERRAAQESAAKAPSAEATPQPPATTPTPQPAATEGGQSEEEMLQQALAMSLEVGGSGGSTQAKGSTAAKPAAAPKAAPAAAVPDFSAMTEEEQIAYAMQISMQDCAEPKEEPMDVDTPSEDRGAKGVKESSEVKKEEEEQDFSQVMADPAFLESVLQNLPGVDPQSQVVKEAVGSLTQQDKDKEKDKDKKKEEKK
ncbi:26S proteasome non-ATPase regulatory subunit 4-like isoform X1 [Penaeus monodon]|uniref:26S proteasome non-ATPase regulatory subunit 4-like isoform X1 n=1 Tax=Penaeus monodon TaxID=6687 RepID=UPI0018A77860|nr:26S proteasome non-ATPase regulatory subunit 4-like isoform X1 [Penaeus monodon]